MFQDDVLKEVHEILQSLDTSAKESIGHAFRKSVEYSKQRKHEAVVQWAGVIEDWCWERLHSGHWKDVPVNYRTLYSLAIALKGDSLKTMGSYREALGTIDKGILLGAPVMDDLLHKMADSLMELIRNEEEESLPEKQEAAVCDCCVSSDEATTKRSLSCSDSVSIHKMIKMEESDEMGVAMTSRYTPINRIHCPSLEQFHNEYMKQAKPVIITGCMDHWPAMNERRWSLEYLKRTAGARTVPVELGSRYTDEGWSQGLMTLDQFIERHIENDSSTKGYLAQHPLFEQVPILQDDICIPDYCCLQTTPTAPDEGSSDDVKINAWFGPSGTVSPLHFDPQQNVLAQVVGSKHIVLFSVQTTPLLYPHDGILSNTSQVDVEDPNYAKYPLFSSAGGMQCYLCEGELLYIPVEWWHYVRSLSLSFSVSFWWS